jgi:hypothetical protein
MPAASLRITHNSKAIEPEPVSEVCRASRVMCDYVLYVCMLLGHMRAVE